MIRATGTVTVNGTITVAAAASGGVFEQANGNLTAGVIGAHSPPTVGNSLSAAEMGEFGDDSTFRFGGSGGTGLSATQLISLAHPGLYGGGGGAAAVVSGPGGAGGGSITILAKTSIVIGASGVIQAIGLNTVNGGGGGAGGIVILASPGSISQAGTVSATGGNGGNATVLCGGGGGGGGGLIRIITPQNLIGGAYNLNGGNGGAAVGNGIISNSPRIGGAGGGGCAGTGGAGAAVNANGSAGAGAAGGMGSLNIMTADPTSLF